eukprot:Transcript_6252.p1 GENE.Transcript_6252~~Transcript_6252.p1  ORF type:complete len:529 (-),score=104.61 Transcript_6252:194-1780(-)
MPRLSRLLPLALALPADGLHALAPLTAADSDELVQTTYTVSWMAHTQAQGDAIVSYIDEEPAVDAPQLAVMSPQTSFAASPSAKTVCVSPNKALATDEWCAALCKSNATQGADNASATPSDLILMDAGSDPDPSECDPDYCTCYDPSVPREEYVKQVQEMEKAHPSGLPECPHIAPEGCSATKPYECMAGPSAGQCSELNWFGTSDCDSSCLHTRLYMFAPTAGSFGEDEWTAGPIAPPDTSGKVPHYKHDPKKMTMSARGINVRKLNVMLTKACKEQQPFVAVTLHSPAYTLKAKRLLRSCTRVGICCKATQAPESFGPEAPEGSEEFRFQLIAMKPAFILSQMELSRLPVAWLDADMEFHQYPTLFSPGSWPGGGRDVALFNYWGNVSKGQVTPSLGSGVAFFNHTHRAQHVLTAWAEAMAYDSNSRAPDDQVLNELLDSGGWTQRASYGWLPVAYLRTVPAFYRGVDPVIDHDHGSAPGLIEHSPTKPKMPPVETEQEANARQDAEDRQPPASGQQTEAALRHGG